MVVVMTTIFQRSFMLQIFTLKSNCKWHNVSIEHSRNGIYSNNSSYIL